MPPEEVTARAQVLRHYLWQNSWLVSGIAFILGWLYEMAAGVPIGWLVLSNALAISSALLIVASFALSGFSYYFDFLDSKLGYRKYLGVVGFYHALLYAITLVLMYPEKYGWGLMSRMTKPEVMLGLAAMEESVPTISPDRNARLFDDRRRQPFVR